LNNLGNVMARLGDYEAARSHFFEALRLYRQAGRRRDEGMVRSNLGLLHHLMEQQAAAVEYSRSAAEIARELGDRVTLGYALTHLGHALLALGKPGEASVAYQEALALREKGGAQSAAMETVAGLARAALARDDVATAHEHAERILSYLEDSPLDGAEEPLRVYLTCVHVLEAAGDEARAAAVRERARRELARQAELIDDEALRDSFRTNVAAHRHLLS
jgi:tetratricopeptide (TPR) repeat protein